MANSRGGSERVFFNSAIQATDSTNSGWTVKTPRRARRTKCATGQKAPDQEHADQMQPRLVRWYPSVLSPQHCHCSHRTAEVRGSKLPMPSGRARTFQNAAGSWIRALRETYLSSSQSQSPRSTGA